jgi:hypothetical protein
MSAFQVRIQIQTFRRKQHDFGFGVLAEVILQGTICLTREIRFSQTP